MAIKEVDVAEEELPMLGEEDAAAVVADIAIPTSEKLSLIGKLAAQVDELTSKIAEAEAIVKQLTEAKRLIEERDLPNALTDVGMSEFTLIGGAKAELKTDYYASIPTARHEAALNWLTAHDLGPLIKTKIQLFYGREERAAAREFIQSLGTSRKYDLKEFVEPATLKAQVSSLIASGKLTQEEYPLFGVYERRWVKITAPKSKKK